MEGRIHPEIAILEEISARLGANPLLVQAGSGNTSIKLGGILWIKASGKWLAHAGQEDIFVPVGVAAMRDCVGRGVDLAKHWEATGRRLRPSIETAMHAVIPHRAVIHVHSVNTIAWAVRRDGQARCAERLAGLAWQWVPYVPSGLPLARQVAKCLAKAPETRVLVLGNHGLVVCGEDCQAAEAALQEVENRLAIQPRRAPPPNRAILEQQIAAAPGWVLPDQEAVHSLATDSVARTTLQGGILYPCQAIFLGTNARMAPHWIVGHSGVIVSRSANQAEQEMLRGLAEVVQRIDGDADLRYLTRAELARVLTQEAQQYRGLVQRSAVQARVAIA